VFFIKLKQKIRVFVFICLILFMFPTLKVVAVPVDIDEKNIEAEEIGSQINSINGLLEETIEQYNLTNVKIDATKKEIDNNSQLLSETVKKLSESQQILNKRLAQIYKHEEVSLFSSILFSRDFRDFITRLDFLVRINCQDKKILVQVQEIKKQLEKEEKGLKEKEQELKALAGELNQKKNSIESQLKNKEVIFNNINRNIASLIKKEEERQLKLRFDEPKKILEEQPETTGTEGSDETKQNQKTPLETTDSTCNGSEIVSIAQNYLGAPYAWGGSAPNGFDCSGFTMYVYKKVGINLYHSAALQYGQCKKIIKSEMMAGDLVFFGKDGISHVGIYVGNGNFIHAPCTDDVVRIQSLNTRSDFVGAGKP